jgi:hypothetical protein
MSVTVPGSNQMMASQQVQGSAISGRGVTLSGFYLPNGDAASRLKLLEQDQGPFTELSLNELEGWTYFVGASGDPALNAGPLKVGYFRRESHRFFGDLGTWFFQTKATSVKRISLCQSSGFLSLTLLYSVGESAGV